MTFCIAAMCHHEGEPAIVCAAERQSTLGDFVKTDDAYKFRYYGWSTMLVSGRSGMADELVSALIPIARAYDQQAKPPEDFDLRISQLLEDFRKVVRQRKSQIVNHEIAMRYNITFDDFLKHGAQWFSPHTYASIQSEIRTIKIGCDVIYTYVHDDEPIIIEITQDGGVVWQDNYSCVGSGSTIGLAILAQDRWTENMTLMDCLARIVLAKTAAERDPYVGTGFHFDISIRGHREVDDISDAGFEYLQQKVARISAPSGLEFKPEFLRSSHTHQPSEQQDESSGDKEEDKPPEES